MFIFNLSNLLEKFRNFFFHDYSIEGNDRMFALYIYSEKGREEGVNDDRHEFKMSYIDIRKTSCALNLFVSAVINADIIDE
jgi:hypothetical protein